jgi:hypothetical protein
VLGQAHERLLAVVGGHHVVAGVGQREAQQADELDVVIHDQDRHADTWLMPEC